MSKKPFKSKTPNKLRTYEVLDQVEHLRQQRRYEEMVALLEPFVRRYPAQRDGWAYLGDAYDKLDNRVGLWDVTKYLFELEPNEPDNGFNAVMVSIANSLPFSALYYANKYLARWPNNEHAHDIKHRQVELESVVAEIRASLSTDVAIEDFMALEQIQMMINRGYFKEAQRLSLELIPRLPGNPAPLNNLSLSYALQGNYAKAIQYAQQVLDRDPVNIHALSNLVDYFLHAGNRAEAERVAELLRQQTPVDDVHWTKQIEAFAFLARDEVVTELYNAYQETEGIGDGPQVIPHHLAAVSFARLGDVKQTRRLWEKVLKINPNFTLARDNLANLQAAPGERSGAWPYTFDQWIPQTWIQALSVTSMKGEKSEAAAKREMLRLLHEIPGMATILPILLERGDPQGREFAIILAGQAELPLLRDFVLGEYGTDQDRLQAAQYATHSRMLPRGKPISLFMQGKRQENLLLDYEIHGNTEPSHLSKGVQTLLTESNLALREGRFTDSEKVIREALEIAPDEPSLLNHLAAALAALGRNEESDATVKRMAELAPDYLFARSAMAQLCVREKRFDEAQQWIDPLLERTRFHVSEFGALCIAQCELLLAEGKKEGAQTWLNFWRHYDPDNPQLERFLRIVRASGLR